MAWWLLFAYCALAHTLTRQVAHRGRRLVYNSTDAAHGEPWHVHAYGCGGAIIAPDLFLTSAACNVTFDVNAWVWAGIYNMSDHRLSQRRTVVQQIFDPAHKFVTYDNPVTGAPRYSAENDYMVVRVNQPWTFNALVGKASLPTQSIAEYRASEFEITSFSSHHGGNYSLADVLQKSTVTYVPCTDNNKGQFCAGGKKGGWKDACSGDSGNPLILKGTSTIVGIASWKEGDVDDDKFNCKAVTTNGTKFTEVFQILDFINGVLTDSNNTNSTPFVPSPADTSECPTKPQPGAADRMCKFPFEADGDWHDGCTNLFEREKLDNFWCATSLNTWAYCSESCPRSLILNDCILDSHCEGHSLSLPMCFDGWCLDGFQCGDGDRVPKLFVCDKIPDCTDESDEQKCDAHDQTI